MEYRRLGRAGIKLSALSFGSWITFGERLDLNDVRKCMHYAKDQGVNFFDNAEAYANGVSELIMGEALRDFRRDELVISTKLFWGGDKPNQQGLSHKHLVEGIQNSLRRMNLEYVDLLYCHRPDPDTPIEETVRAMDLIIRKGWAFYWGTSEWSADQIEEAHRLANALGMAPPAMEQPEYNLFKRQRVEDEYAPLYDTYGMGTTTWSPLEMGILSGKYRDGVPKNSRMAKHEGLSGRLTGEKVARVRDLETVAHELNCTLPQLAIAWCLKNPHVSSVILGASSFEQLQENLQSFDVLSRLDHSIKSRIEEITNVESIV